MSTTRSLRSPELSSRRKWLTLLAMVFGLFMPMLDNLVVNVALPTVQRSLSATVSDLQWIVDAYTLTFASFMLTGGALGDISGRKKLFLTGLVVFTIASLGCGTAESTEALIGFRAIQGFGAALLLPGSLSILTATFHGRQLGTAIGVWAAMSGLAVAVGPLVGGYLVENHSWESIFLINVPVGIVGVLLTALVVRESRDWRASRTIDIPGLLTGTAGVFLLVYGLIEGGNRGWTDGVILSCFGFSALFLIVFVVIESRRYSPMLPLYFFRNPTFAASNVVAAAVFFALFGTTFFLPLYLQNVRGFSPFETGARLVPLTLAILVIAPLAGRLSDRRGSRGLMAAGCVIAALGMALLLLTEPDSSYASEILPAFLVLGSGMGLAMAPMTAAAMTSVNPEHAGVASGVTNTTRELGGVLGIAVLGAVVTDRFKDRFLEQLLESGLPAETSSSIVASASSNAAAGGGSLATFRRQAPAGTPEPVVEGVLASARDAFVDALHSGLLIAIGFMVLASLAALIFVRSRVRSDQDEDERGAVATAPFVPPAPPAAPAAQSHQRPGSKPPADQTSDTPSLPSTRANSPDPSALDRMRHVLHELPFKAGNGTVGENLAEIARATVAYYDYGLAHDSSINLPVGASDDARASSHHDIAAVAGYLDLEQRLGRIDRDISPELAATLLMGALAAHALGHGIAGDYDLDWSLEFAGDMAKVLVNGIGAGNGQLGRYVGGGVNRPE